MLPLRARCLPLIACTLLLPAVTTATTARQAALGGGEFIEDDRNVLRWYASLVDYPDEITVEAGHFTLPEGWHDVSGQRVSGPGLGFQHQLDATGRWGTAAVWWHGHGDDADPGSLGRDRLGSTWTGIWARRFGSVQGAVMARRGSGDQTNAGTAFDRTRTEVGLGLRWDIAPGAYLDLAGESRHHTEITTRDDGTVNDVLDRSGNSRGLRARAFVRLGDATALVPLLEYVDEDRPTAHPDPANERALRGHLLKVGAGLNWYPDADHFLLVAADHTHGHADRLGGDPDASLDVLDGKRWDAVALTAGFETRFRYWLMFRGSFRYEAVSETSADGLADDDWARFGVNVGAAVQLGPADLDFAISDREPRPFAGAWGTDLPIDPSTWLAVTCRWRY